MNGLHVKTVAKERTNSKDERKDARSEYEDGVE